MPVFFLSTGLRINWAMSGSAILLAAMVLLVASIAGKIIGTRIAGRIFAWSRAESSLISWLLQIKAPIMIIFVNILLDKGMIPSEKFSALLLMAVLSTMLTVPVVAPWLQRLRSLISKLA